MWPVIMLLLAAGLAVVLLLLGVVAAVIGAIVAAVHLLPLLLILAGVWLLVRAMRGSDHGRRAEAASRRGPWSAPGPARQRPSERQPVEQRPVEQRPVERHARRPRPEARPRRALPIDVEVKVEQVRRKADVLLSYADRFPPFSQDLHIVRQTAAEYLPRTVTTYLALPGDDDPIVETSGKTALQELREQLGLMDAKLDEITQSLQRSDLDRMLANRRFLEERFDVRTGDDRTEAPRQETGAA